MMAVIDVHAHCVPVAFREWLDHRAADVGLDLSPAGPSATVTFGDRTTAPMPPDASPLDRRMGELDRMGIDVQVLAGWIDLTGYELEARAAVTYSQAHNDLLADEASQSPDRFVSIGTVPLQSPDRAVAELDRCMNDLGMRGIEIATTVRGVALDKLDLDPLWEAAADLNAFVLLHPMTPLTGVDLDRYFMSNLVGRPAESTITIAGLILSGVFERHPDLTMCIVHGGGFAPFQMGRLDRGAEIKPLPGITRRPSDYLRDLYVDTVVHDRLALEYIVRVFGADHVLAGTDYPFPMGDLDPVSFVGALDLSDEDRAAILGGTAARLLGLSY